MQALTHPQLGTAVAESQRPLSRHTAPGVSILAQGVLVMPEETDGNRKEHTKRDLKVYQAHLQIPCALSTLRRE